MTDVPSDPEDFKSDPDYVGDEHGLPPDIENTGPEPDEEGDPA